MVRGCPGALCCTAGVGRTARLVHLIGFARAKCLGLAQQAGEEVSVRRLTHRSYDCQLVVEIDGGFLVRVLGLAGAGRRDSVIGEPPGSSIQWARAASVLVESEGCHMRLGVVGQWIGGALFSVPSSADLPGPIRKTTCTPGEIVGIETDLGGHSIDDRAQTAS